MLKIAVRDAGSFLATIPHLLTYVPAQSLVVVGLRDNTSRFTLRADLPLARPPVGPQARPFVEPFVNQGCDRVCLAVICDTPAATARRLPFASVVARLSDSYRAEDIQIGDCLWAPRLAAGAPWRRYDRPDTGTVARADAGTRVDAGVVPDPFGPQFADLLAGMGSQRTLPDRAALAAQLAPAEPAVLRRRQRLIERRLAEPTRPFTSELLAVLDRWVDSSAQARPVLGDEDVAALCVALDDPPVYQEALRCALGERTAGARNLWCALLTQAPGRHSADAAVLLVWCELLRGDGRLVTIALEHARHACPTHEMAELIREAVGSGVLRPDTAREALVKYLAMLDALGR